MLRKPLLSLILALVLGAGFVYGLLHLFVLRFEVGDIYPPYSSLRADPLGTKALAAALDELPGVDVSRNFKPLTRLHPAAPITLVYTGVPHQSYWTEPEVSAFDALILSGSRAVFTFFPSEQKPDKKEETKEADEERVKKRKRIKKETPEAERKKEQDAKKIEAKKDEGKDTKKSDPKKDEKKKNEDAEDSADAKGLIGFDEVAKRWGFTFDYLPAEKKEAFARHAALVEPGGHLEPDLTWHSALYFRDLKPHWKVLYMCGTMPVVIERKYGAGSIILVADSFLVSNEALRKERYPLLFSRLFSGPPAVVFDEESRGLQENPGIATLVRKYRLHGAVIGLFLIGIFFVWKNAVRFVPAYHLEVGEGDVVAGKESSEGFVNLLRRSINPSSIFETCLAEWRKAVAHRPRDLAQVEEIWAQYQSRPAKERDPIATYRAISRVLARK